MSSPVEADLTGKPLDDAQGPWLEVGRVARAHGVRGEVAVDLVTNVPDRVSPGLRVRLGGRAEWVVAAVRPGPRGRLLVRFEGVRSRDAAEELRGEVVSARHCGGPPGEVWVHELVGRPVVDRAGLLCGRVVAVEANPASDLLVLEGGQLVPLCFLTERAPDGSLVIDPPPGLLEGPRAGDEEATDERTRTPGWSRPGRGAAPRKGKGRERRAPAAGARRPRQPESRSDSDRRD